MGSFIKNSFILFIFTFILEVTFRLISGINIIDLSLLRIGIGLLFISIFISFILSWINRKANRFIVIGLFLVISFYVFFQIGFNNFIGVYASVNSSSQLGAVTDYIKDFFMSFSWKFYLSFIPLVLMILYYVLLDKKVEFLLDKTIDKINIVKYRKLIRLSLGLVLLLVIGNVYYKSLTVNFMQKEYQVINNRDLFSYPSVPSVAINEFGVIGFGILDIKSYGEEIPDSYTFSSDVINIERPSNREIDDSEWQELIDNEKDKELNLISNTLINGNITGYNDYTGMFEDKNLIVIMMESVNDIIINEELYPNFYKLYSEGMSFTNNYSPRNSCATGNNEFSGMTGLYTIQNNCTANKYRKNTYFTSIFNLFNNAGYNTSSMHNYTEAYYYRSIIHPNLGSGKYYGAKDLGIKYYTEYKNWSSDEDFMEAAMDITLKDTKEPFMVWLTTVSSHQPYGVSSIEGDKYLSITEGTDYSMSLRRYMSKLKTLDNSLGILLEKLEKADELDDTVIVLYGDHYPYGLKDKEINSVLDYDLEDYEVERVPFVIYNSEMEAKKIDKYTSYINLTPTIANLFNLEYDPRYYMGMDVLSDEYIDLVVFADGSWKNKNYYYDASKAQVNNLSNDLIDKDEIKKINNLVNQRMKVSSMIIENNYFNYLDEKLYNNSVNVSEDNKKNYNKDIS